MSVTRYEMKTTYRGHESWDSLEEDEEGGYVDYEDYLALEKKLTEMAVQLANAESKCSELVAENAGLKNPDNWLSHSDYGYEASEVATQNGATEDESLRAGMIAIINRIGTPATDAFLAEVRAQGVDLVCDYHKSRCEALFDVDRKGSQRHGAALCDAIDIAAKLRKGAAL